MSNNMYDKEFFISFLSDTFKERISYLENNCSILDIETIACDLYYGLTESLYKNLSGDVGKGCCVKEKDLLEEILSVRRQKLDNNFAWNDVYKKQLLELNEKVMNSFNMAYYEAKRQFHILEKRKNFNDRFLDGYNLEIVIKPYMIVPYEKEFYLKELGKGVTNILNNIIPDFLWSERVLNEYDLDELKEKKYDGDGENFNYNSYLGENIFTDEYICWGLYELFEQTKYFMSWYDILKISEICVEVKVTNQHIIEDIGKGTFWEDNLQSLSDNEAENLRQEYISRIGRDITGLPVDLFIDEMNCWEKIGSFKRIKFHAIKSDTIDFRSVYSMSIEKTPRILVKDAQIDLTDNELQQVKDFVVKNKKFLLNIINEKATITDFAKKLKKI